MAPKRKTVRNDNVPRQVMQCIGKRVASVNRNDETTIDAMSSLKKNQMKKTIKTKPIVKKNKKANNETITENSSVNESVKSMSVDSLINIDSIEVESASMSESSICPSPQPQLKPSTRLSINTNDDEDDEFCKMFMSNTPKVKNNTNYSSTPLCISRKSDKNVRTTSDSSSSYNVKDTALSRLSHSNTDNCSKISDLPVKSVQTPINCSVASVLPQIQTSSSIRSLSSVQTKSNNLVILETFPEYRDLKRNFERVSKENEAWLEDYKALTLRMKQLQQTSFPRPSVDGRLFLEQLLHSLKTIEADEDRRTNAELAGDLGLSEATLMSLSNIDPQKASLRVFNALFSTNKSKEDLKNVAYVTTEYPNLLDDILAHSYRRHAALQSIIDTLSYAGARVPVADASSSLYSASDIPFSLHSLPSPNVPNLSPSNRSRSCSTSSCSSISSEYSCSSNNFSTCSIDDDDFNSINIDVIDDVCAPLSSSYELEDIAKSLTSKEIAVLLVELRYRHSLTRSCITHICELLQLLRVPNAPLNFTNIESLILCAYRSTTFPSKAVICPSCFKRSSSSKMCTGTPNCDSQSSFVRVPTMNYTFALEPQIRSIIERNPIMKRKPNKQVLSDITDGLIYEKILEVERQPFVTLLMNSDGGLVKATSASVWITTLVINELPRKLRYLPENVVLGMLTIGGMKPKKIEMSEIMFDMVNELRRLEEGIGVYFRHDNENDSEQMIKIFLLACTCDKPATSLLLNHKESTGFYGCTYCTIKGDLKQAQTLKNDHKLPNCDKVLSEEASIGYLKGLKGACALRQLSHFDVYKSFLCDTLHNLYLGATVTLSFIILQPPNIFYVG
ncbi:unnamed protein product [Rotaria sp. Silwood1]|nr:unnamed protein product [Rotaria sp. Silwood1]CAF4911673.1 unnamed protein product [Rotaria sp. Silwood1]CAF4968585.1 unnamed protein product [Rotaria sp. Silwood1]